MPEQIAIMRPPWALPREEIPVHVKIDKKITPLLESVTVCLPECFEVRETINITERQTRDGRIVVTSIGKTQAGEFDYFGVVIATKEPFEELKRSVPIMFEFRYKDGRVEQRVKDARIFRPLLDLKDSPEQIVLTDKDDGLRIPLGLRFSGFGEVKMRMDCTIEGKVVSVGASMLDELLRRILDDGGGGAEAGPGIRVGGDLVEDLVLQLREKIKNDESTQRLISEGRLAKEDLELLCGLSNEDKKDFVNAYFRSIEGYVANIISDILRRNPSSNLQIESHAKIQTRISLPVTETRLRLFYTDLAGNEYPPIEKVVKIIDERESPANVDVVIPIEIRDVDESGAYKNVGAEPVGAG